MDRIWISIIVMILVTYMIRVLPLTLLRKPIQNRFLKSFLFYVPYVTLAVMTFPAITQATDNSIAGWLALFFGVAAAWYKANLIQVASICCITVLVTGLTF